MAVDFEIWLHILSNSITLWLMPDADYTCSCICWIQTIRYIKLSRYNINIDATLLKLFRV